MVLAPPMHADPGAPAGLAEYEAGDYAKAVPLLLAASAGADNPAQMHAALLSALVQLDRVEEAQAEAAADERQWPESADVLAARGEWEFYMGDVVAANKLFRSALQHEPSQARALYGLSLLAHAESLYRTARILCLQAHQADPDDALVTRRWLTYLVGPKRDELTGPFIESHPWLYPHGRASEATRTQVREQLNGKPLFATEGEPKEQTLHLFPIIPDARTVVGLGLELQLNEGRPLHLQFDTGAHGILLEQFAIEKAGLDHLGKNKVFGIGDAGTRNAFHALADSCQVGRAMRFRNCLVESFEGRRLLGDSDGLIGADFFSDYLVQVDFAKRELHLRPLPTVEETPQGYDRVIPPEEKDFTPVLREGHHLLVPTILNDRSHGLFLLDTGSSRSMVDSTFAQLSTKISTSNFVPGVKGISGHVKTVFEADKAVLRFAQFRQENLGLLAFDLNKMPEGSHGEIREAGILGYPVLSMFRITLDYRNGLVKFEYVNGQHS